MVHPPTIVCMYVLFHLSIFLKNNVNCVHECTHKKIHGHIHGHIAARAPIYTVYKFAYVLSAKKNVEKGLETLEIPSGINNPLCIAPVYVIFMHQGNRNPLGE